jgi:hypothetical protein
MPLATVHKVLQKWSCLYAYKVQILQELKPEDNPRLQTFSFDMLVRIGRPLFLRNIMFSDEATFHVSDAVTRHNVRIWGSQQPHTVIEHARGSPKVNVWSGVMCNMIIQPFLFEEKAVRGSSYLNMLHRYTFPQLEPQQPNVFFQQDGASPHWSLDVQRALNVIFPGRWIGRDGPKDEGQNLRH